ncbi:hypothetical protein E5F05_04640 (plasmid) [Deinococcus metallilatus]|uniref:Uncharacterized protein n=1 Tax=Deinococcus metallilatus TaxID=1211322 RepID=A0AAJ5F5D3_9DEIO|nr:hypothetical protein [Deinococcus metallilatus]MBB5293766.1 hypothetical protein [Deinococcus metallilatus]QBY07274.1 hypothetical protein E5F05_04640 [Deinococcus metallilatus]RXJ14746.1 hypothetical protein ERJ73_03370 [Deinococcus metallilatus]TLK30866.1 hypothetical protein FCS05_03685 [Deinococcus metallilatus]GMA17695.1 hypothetical protein GCM10025871_40260 [Deinococcus metallilatus]
MLLPISAEPLNFPLNFTWTDKATAKAGAALLTQGDYDAIELRRYAEHQKCHGCDTREKAKTLVVVRDRLTGETFEIGLQCMGDLYGVNIGTLSQHASDVAKTRRSLALKLGLSGDLPTERQVAIIREAVATYVPVPERLLRELDGLDVWNLPPLEQDRVRDLHQLACYHREWREAPDHAHRRWRALSGHPAFAYTPRRQEVHDRCMRALSAAALLPETEIIRLISHLREAAAFKSKLARLAAPEEFPSREAYEAALEARLRARVRLGQPVDHRLSGDRAAAVFNPTQVVGLEARALYATAAVWDDEAEPFRERLHATEPYWKKVRRPVIAVGPVDFQQVPPVKGRRYNEKDEEWEEYDKEPAWTFRFRRVAWALVEPYTDTYPLWHTYGRDRLERYT